MRRSLALFFLAAAFYGAAISPAQEPPPTSVAPAPAAVPPAATVPAATAPAAAAPAPAPLPTAAVLERVEKLMEKRLFSEAVKILDADIKAKDEAQCGKQMLTLAECYYMTGQYENARPCFIKAGKLLRDKQDQIVVDFRLACLAFRLNDQANAVALTDAFLAKYPDSPHGGKLLVYKMQMLAARGKPAQPEVEALYARIGKDFRNTDATVGMEADQTMGGYYRKIGLDDKAKDMYASIVHNFRLVIVRLQETHRPVSMAAELAHDNAAIQLGLMCIDRKQTDEAMKWFENVKYNTGMKQKARLLLAKLAFEKGDYAAAQKYLVADGYLDTVPAGQVRSDMCLILGLAESKLPSGSDLKQETYLKGVAPGGKGFFHAQLALGDLYRGRKASVLALQAYSNCLVSADYAPAALYGIGSIHLADASRSPADSAQAQALYRKAGEIFTQLVTKYPLSPDAKEAGKQAEFLATKGVTVASSKGDQEQRAAWERIAADKPGSYEAVQALLSIVRANFKSVVEEKSGRLLQAPDYAACAKTCDRLLDEAVYSGKGYEAAVWKNIRAEALYLRGKCELASTAPPQDVAARAVQPVYLAKADPARAREYLKQAKSLVDAKQLDLVKKIEISLLEAMFKSNSKDIRQEAEKRFQEMTDNYGDDQNFQLLGIDLAEWCKENGRYADAGRHYAGVADRGRNMEENDVLRVRYAAGMLYSKAAGEAHQQKKDISYAIYIYPKEEISAADDLAKTYAPLRMPVTMRWPGGGKITAEEALRALSKAARLPFIWATNSADGAVDKYLKAKMVSLEDGPTTVSAVLMVLLDKTKHKLAFDIGLVEGRPTFTPPQRDADGPDEAASAGRVVEIYDVGQAAGRYKPLARNYGAWQKLYANKPQILFSIIKRVEEISATRVLWAEGLDKEEKQAVEFKAFPGTPVHSEVTCGEALAKTLESLGLRHRIVARELATDYYDAAKEQFSKLRQLNPRSKWAEKAMGQWWLNYYDQKDYEKMKVVLREYLKVFDNPSHEHYRHACFWEGWTWEYDKNYGEACRCYARAAEERLVVFKPAKLPTREELRKQISYDTLFAISAPVSGVFTNNSVASIIEFVRVNTRVELRVDAGLPGLEAACNPGEFHAKPALDLLGDALEKVGLSISVENMDPELAERSYFRMMTCYKKDDLMPQALENAMILLNRYPQSKRRKDTYQTMLDIYKGLRDYGNVLAVLDELARSAGDEIEKFKFDYEKGSIFFDMADYAQAAEIFKGVLGKAAGFERVYAREAYARSLMRMENIPEALIQFQGLLKEERDPLRLFADQVLIFCLQLAAGKVDEPNFPEDWTRYSRQYGQLSDDDRGKLSTLEISRVMWIYFAQAMVDIRKQRLADAEVKLNAVTTAPDDFLAADAGYRLGMLYLDGKQYGKARETFEYLLVFTKSSESAVRATYALACCLEALGQTQAAGERYAQLVERYPLSPYVALIKQNPNYKQRKPEPKPKAASEPRTEPKPKAWPKPKPEPELKAEPERKSP